MSKDIFRVLPPNVIQAILKEAAHACIPFACGFPYYRDPVELKPTRGVDHQKVKEDLNMHIRTILNPAISFKPRDLNNPLWQVADDASMLTGMGIEIYLPGALHFNRHTVHVDLDSGNGPERWSFWIGSTMEEKVVRAQINMAKIIPNYPTEIHPWKIFHIERGLTGSEIAKNK